MKQLAKASLVGKELGLEDSNFLAIDVRKHCF